MSRSVRDVRRAATGHDLDVAVRRVVMLPFRRPAPASDQFHPAVRQAASPRPVTGFIVGVSDGATWGWWGPVTEEIAVSARRLAEGSLRWRAATPMAWATRVRRTVRHAHTGLLGVACGVVELACWDLLGQRHGVPVWRLLTDRPAGGRLASYATCFGVRLDDPAARAVAERVREEWRVQKWRPVRRMLDRRHPAYRTAAQAGPDGLALDFGATWSWGALRRLCEALPFRLAWIEEPWLSGEMRALPIDGRPAPVAGGEHCYGPDETAILEAAGIDVWQPDAVFCGGLSAYRAIALRAASVGRRLAPHGGGLLPALHAWAAGAPTEMVECHLLLEPRRQSHLAHPITPGPGGVFAVPELPGWAGPLHRDLTQCAGI